MDDKEKEKQKRRIKEVSKFISKPHDDEPDPIFLYMGNYNFSSDVILSFLPWVCYQGLYYQSTKSTNLRMSTPEYFQNEVKG